MNTIEREVRTDHVEEKGARRPQDLFAQNDAAGGFLYLWDEGADWSDKVDELHCGLKWCWCCYFGGATFTNGPLAAGGDENGRNEVIGMMVGTHYSRVCA